MSTPSTDTLTCRHCETEIEKRLGASGAFFAVGVQSDFDALDCYDNPEDCYSCGGEGEIECDERDEDGCSECDDSGTRECLDCCGGGSVPGYHEPKE